MGLQLASIEEFAGSFSERQPQDILAFALDEYSSCIGISFSGAEDVVLVDMVAKLRGKSRVFSLDTGRLHPESHQFLEKVREHYGITIEAYFPRPEAVEELVREGRWWWEDPTKKECGLHGGNVCHS